MRDSEEQAFFDAIAANPDDRLVRLVYADWLEEHYNEKRAKYIRLSCRRDETSDPKERWELTEQMEKMRYDKDPWYFTKEGDPDPMTTRGIVPDWYIDSATGRWWGDRLVERLGMPYSGQIGLSDFLRHGASTSPPFRSLNVNAESDAELRKLAACTHLADLNELKLHLVRSPTALQEVLRSTGVKNLCSLSLNNCRTESGFADVFADPAFCPKLKSLEIRNTLLGDEVVAQLLSSPNVRRLEQLELIGVGHLGGAAIAALTDAPLNCLKELRLSSGVAPAIVNNQAMIALERVTVLHPEAFLDALDEAARRSRILGLPTPLPGLTHINGRPIEEVLRHRQNWIERVALSRMSPAPDPPLR